MGNDWKSSVDVRPRARAVGLVAVLSATSLAIGARRPGTGGRSTGSDRRPLGSTPDEAIDGNKSLTSRIAETDPALLGRTDATPVEVLVKLDYDSVATYQGASTASRRPARRSPVMR